MTAYEEDGVTVSWTYKGAFDNGWMTGQGKMTKIGTPDNPGYIYEGDHVKGKAHGRGTGYYPGGYPDGAVAYVGNHVNGEYHGQGTLTCYTEDGGPEGAFSWIYEGEFLKNKATGQGTTTYGESYPDLAGYVYHGTHVNGEAHGHGTWYYPDGAVAYVGNHVNGEYHGQGTSHRHDGNIREDGTREDGTKEYDGQWKKSCWCGHGTLFHPDGTISPNGNWVNGGSAECKWQGEEEMFWYEGDWDDDNRMHGWGILYRPDGCRSRIDTKKTS